MFSIRVDLRLHILIIPKTKFFFRNTDVKFYIFLNCCNIGASSIEIHNIYRNSQTKLKKLSIHYITPVFPQGVSRTRNVIFKFQGHF